MNKCILSLAALALTGLSARASLLFYDGFGYSAGDLATQSGGTWTNINTGPNVTTPGLTFDTLSASGNSTTLTGTYTGAHRASGVTQSFVQAGTVYMSALFSVDRDNVTWGAGEFASVYLATNSGTNNNLGLNFGIAANSTGVMDAYITFKSPSGTGAGDFDALGSGGLTDNTTYFMVAKFEVTDAVNNLANLSLGVFDTTMPGSESFSITAENVSYGTPLAGSNAMDTLFIYKNNTPGSSTFDEIRVGTSWDDVVVIPEPGTLALVGLALGSMLLFRRRG